MVQSKLHLHPRPQPRARPVTSGAQLSEEGRGQLLQSNPEGWRLAVGTKGGGCRAPSCKGFTPGMGHLADRYRDVVHGTGSWNGHLEWPSWTLNPSQRPPGGWRDRHQNPEAGMAVMRSPSTYRESHLPWPTS